MDNSGNFIIAWGDGRNGGEDIYAQRYSSDGTALGNNFKVNDKGIGGNSPSIATDNSGHFVITWEDDRNGDDDIYAQRYSSDGTTLGENFKVNDGHGSSHPRDPAISADNNGNFVIMWVDDRKGDSDIFAQRYLRDGTTLGENFRVTNTSHKNQFSPDVKLWNGLIYTTWVDNRAGGTGYDIWANVLDWDNPTVGIGDKEQSLSPSTYILNQNYPNPFNPSTTINYSIPKQSYVAIKVFDLQGRTIATLVNKEQLQGHHLLKFNATGFTSGIYFYALFIDNNLTETKRMLYMK
jgi:hypothetical protein